jgi:hypothetical protein
MLIVGFQMIGIKWFQKFSFNIFKNNSFLDKNQEVQGRYIPAIVGGMTFFVPCGFTLIAQSNAITAGGFTAGFVGLLAFSLGTLPVLALISFSSFKFHSNPSFSKKFSLASGVLILFFALYTLNAQLNVLGVKSLSDVRLSKNVGEQITETPIDNNDDFQVMKMEAKGFAYSPPMISIKSGVKTRLDIQDNGATGCARAVFARGLYPDVIFLKPGMNSVEFMAPKPGTYKISCSMGMVPPVTVVVD